MTNVGTIQMVSKYAPVRGIRDARRSRPAGSSKPKAQSSKFTMAQAVDALHRQAQLASPLILIPRFRTTFNRPDWVWQELREGGRLKRYLQVEQGTTAQRWRAVARARAGFQQNNKSELKLKASIPAIDYFRFARMDKDFWKDDANLRSLRRDNPEVATIYD